MASMQQKPLYQANSIISDKILPEESSVHINTHVELFRARKSIGQRDENYSKAFDLDSLMKALLTLSGGKKRA